MLKIWIGNGLYNRSPRCRDEIIDLSESYTVKTDALLDAIVCLMRFNKIEAIRLTRTSFGWGLKEAKEFCEKLNEQYG